MPRPAATPAPQVEATPAPLTPAPATTPAPPGPEAPVGGWKANERYAALWTDSFQSLVGQHVTLYGTPARGGAQGNKGFIAFFADDLKTTNASQRRTFTAEISDPVLAGAIGSGRNPTAFWVTGTFQTIMTTHETVTAPDGTLADVASRAPHLVDAQLKEDK
jgi:hypothetical protein